MKYFKFILLLFIIACVQEPNAPDIQNSNLPYAVILCEGLQGMENASITIVDEDFIYENNFYQNINSTALGDTGNDILIQDSIAYVALTGSGAVQKFNINSGKALDRYVLSDFFPRSFASNDDMIFVSDLYSNNIHLIQDENISIFEDRMLQNPEQVLCIQDKLYVANSGLGIFNQHKDHAGKITIYDLNDDGNISNTYVGPNPQEIIYDENQDDIIISYYNTYEKDSVGGIVIYDDLNLKKEKLRLNVNNTSLYVKNIYLYYIAQTPPGSNEDFTSSIMRMNLKTYKTEKIITNYNSKEFWYSLAIDDKNRIWVGNAKNFQIEGEIIIFDENGAQIKTIPTGVNPTKIVFTD